MPSAYTRLGPPLLDALTLCRQTGLADHHLIAVDRAVERPVPTELAQGRPYNWRETPA